MSEFGGIPASGHPQTYDAIGNITSQTSNVGGVSSYTGSTNYSYDSRNELSQEQSTRMGGYTYNNQYDSAENPTEVRNTPETYNSDDQQTSNSYDGSGNPTTYNGNACQYDPNSHMTSFGSILTAGYMSDGLRAWKQNSTGRTYFLYDGGFPVCELNSSGAVTAVNTWGAKGVCARHTTSAGSVFYAYDGTGSVAERTNTSGAVIDSFCFDAFGKRSATDTTTDPYTGFGGQYGNYMDSETGLILMGQRYYDPTAERFLNRDPEWPEGGLDTYNYCSNRPLNMIDPDGCWRDSPGSPVVDNPPPAPEPATAPAPAPEPPVGGFPGDPVPGVGGAVGGGAAGGAAGGSVGLLPVAVIVCGIEAGREVCTYNPNDPNHSTGPFTCLGNAIWHHCIEPLFPQPIFPPLPIPVQPPITAPCPPTDPGNGKTADCDFTGFEIIIGNKKQCRYSCIRQGYLKTFVVEVPIDSICPPTYTTPVP